MVVLGLKVVVFFSLEAIYLERIRQLLGTLILFYRAKVSIKVRLWQKVLQVLRSVKNLDVDLSLLLDYETILKRSFMKMLSSILILRKSFLSKA